MPTSDQVAADDAARLVGADRVLAVLKELARHPGGVSLEGLTRAMGSPKPTVHRALAALRRAGLADRDAYGHYLLGDEFLRIAFTHHEARPDHLRILPALQALAARFGETAHYAVLDGHEVVYRAKVDPPAGAVRLSSVVGGRNLAHTTGVGKVLLAHELATLADVRSWAGGRPLPRRTPRSLGTPEELHRELDRVRERGYAVDDEENESGVACLAVPVFTTSATRPDGAVSVSALAYRTPLATLVDAVGEIRAAVAPPGP